MKVSRIRLIVLCGILVLCIAASVIVYRMSIVPVEEENFLYLYDYVSNESLTGALRFCDMMKMLPESEEFIDRLFSGGRMNRMEQALRDLADAHSDRDNYCDEEIDAPEEIWYYQQIIFSFIFDLMEHAVITDEQIIGIESLTHDELAAIKAEEPNYQYNVLSLMQPLYRGDTSYSHSYVNNFLDDEHKIENLDFLNDVVFTEFVQTGKVFDAENSEFVYYFTTQTEDGKGLVIGDMSGTEWVVRMGYAENWRLRWRRLMPLDMYLAED